MERLIGLLFIGWLAFMAVGVIIALLPVIAFVAGFVAVILIFAFVGRWVSSWLW
jgi:hypothetical protein